MPICDICGGEIIFRYVDGACKPIHLNGGCYSYSTTSKALTTSKPNKSLTKRHNKKSKKKKVNAKKINNKKSKKQEITFKSYESFVNPNASCPVCGEQVFYYQSEDGGRVFFDELGPPWPKHPCTNNYRPSNKRRNKATITSKQKSNHSQLSARMNQKKRSVSKQEPNSSLQKSSAYKWQIDGWKPFFVNDIASTENNRIKKLSGIIDENSFEIYVKSHLNININLPIFIKPSPFKYHLISTIKYDKKTKEYNKVQNSGYCNIQDLIDVEERIKEYNQSKKSSKKENKPKQPNKSVKVKVTYKNRKKR